MDHFTTAQQFHQAINRLRGPRRRVVSFGCASGLRGEKKRPGQVGHIQKIAALGAIADNGERFARQLLRQENPENRTVSARGARARSICVENADR